MDTYNPKTQEEFDKLVSQGSIDEFSEPLYYEKDGSPVFEKIH